MARRVEDLTGRPDQAASQSLQLTERLALTFQAHQDFERSLAIADSFIDEGSDLTGSYLLTYIARSQVHAGFDPTETIARLYQLASQTPENYSGSICQGIAEIYIELGDFNKVQEVLDRAPHFRVERSFFFNLAKAKAKHGQDPSPELLKVRTEIEELDEKFRLGSINSYAQLAEAHYQATGEYPEDYLGRAEANIEDYAREHPGEIHLPGWYGDIARAYATCGNFERALALVDRIQGYNPISEAQTKMWTLGHIAREHVARRLYKEGAETARRAIQTIEQAEPEPEHLRSHLLDSQTFGVIKLLTLIGKAQGLAGENGSETFKRALELVEKTPYKGGYWAVDVLADITRAQRTVGVDETLTLTRALKELDDLPKAEDYDGFYDLTLLLMGYEELAKLHAEFTQFSEARIVLSRLEALKDEGADIDIGSSVEWSVAEVLASIAENEARQGLSSDDLKALSPTEIQAILRSDNELAKQAATSLGLAK